MLPPAIALAIAIAISQTAPSTPVPAAFREERFAESVADGRLSGTLTLPAGAGPFRVALIIAGSGPTDRDGNGGAVLATNAYLKLAHDLARDGIATLRYDKRGVGSSTSTMPESELRLDTFVDDALVLTHVLERDRRFRSVSLIGHSEGSLIAERVAARDHHIRALVSLEGPGRNLATIIEEQVRANPANPPAIVAEVRAYDASLLAGKTVPNVDPLLAPLYRSSVQPYLISTFAHDPAKDLATLEIPVLIVHGTTDLQVGTADAEALERAAPSATFAEMDGMNHVLVDAPMDRAANFATYTEPDLPLHDGLVREIAAFLRARAR